MINVIVILHLDPILVNVVIFIRQERLLLFFEHFRDLIELVLTELRVLNVRHNIFGDSPSKSCPQDPFLLKGVKFFVKGLF